MLNLKKYKNFDWILLASAIAIFILGLLFLFSSTYPNNTDFVFRQIMWFLVGVLALLFIANVNYRKIVGIGHIFYFLTVVLLLSVFIFGSRRLGAQRWLVIGGFNIQPSEFGKLFVILSLVQYLASQKKYRNLKNIVVPLGMIAVPFILILRQPDLGTALMFVPVLIILLYVWGLPLRNLFFMVLCGALFSPFGWFLLKDYQKDRLLVFMDPGRDPLGAGYTVIQSRIAIGSGGFFGKGWLSGTQNQLNFLAERHTDFIFSVAGEEWGFLGGIILLGLYYILIKRAISIAEKTPDPCGKLLAVGLATMIGIQVVVNLSMTMGFMPVVGLPLPLVSYGGSSLLVTLMAVGLLESIAVHR
ncbi:MAG: rod shape-determining protein RodA [Candidatus Omnitrophica bacterium]|nr:rod shape-determining protein RodA [Candidatus Omnitrophota bacterium]MBU1853736.1 rod shape-determining protein RodA [Candidatus Omnitrophota bacterium]